MIILFTGIIVQFSLFGRCHHTHAQWMDNGMLVLNPLVTKDSYNKRRDKNHLTLTNLLLLSILLRLRLQNHTNEQ